MIESGEKKEEYRNVTEYWGKRLINHQYDYVCFHKGYTNITMTFEILGVECNYSNKTEWGAEHGIRYFIIKLGKRFFNVERRFIIRNPETGACIKAAEYPKENEKYAAYIATKETKDKVFKVFPKSLKLLESAGTGLIIKADCVEDKLEILTLNGEPYKTMYNGCISSYETLPFCGILYKIEFDWMN
jgi:hypothetical protein